MNKVFLIIKREYLTRVRKRSFLVMTILGPLLTGGLITAVVYLSAIDNEHRTVVVIDNTHQFEQKFKNDESTTFVYLNEPLDSLRRTSKTKGYFGILYIPATSNKKNELEQTTTFYSEKQPSFELLEKIKFTMEKEINYIKYAAAGIDPEKLKEIKTNVRIQTRDLENNKTSTPLSTVVGFVCGILVYFFTLLYGVQVMRGIMEEKMNRIVEVIISSVKPFQLMMGKIIGIALVGLTQFLLWIILSGVIYGAIMSKAPLPPKGGFYNMQIQQGQGGLQESNLPPKADGGALAKQVSDAVSQINFSLIIGLFIFYFLGGYLLYAALFAAIGSAVDAETDTQQFMFPITIPLILAYVASINVINNPDGPLGFWFSQIPFTSPIVMMVRIPIGVWWGQVVSSMIFLIIGFVFTTWLAAKIYRTGILMYGKKVNYMELWKWIRYSS